MVPTMALKLVTRWTLKDFKVVRVAINELKKIEHYVPMTTTGNEAARTISASAFASMTVGAAIKHNDVILTNLMTSHCFNPIPWKRVY